MTPEKTILLCTIGSAGDVNPLIGIRQQLKNAVFASSLLPANILNPRRAALYLLDSSTL
jgi:hypothetical protein